MDLQAKAKALLVSYSDIFSKDDLDLGTTNLTKYDIKLTDYTPFKAKYRRIPPHLYEEVRAHLKEMIDLGAIKKSQSPWSSPIVLVRKKDGKLRFCIDLRKLNQRTVRDNYSLPRIDHILELLIGAEWFCTLDLKSGYWQVELTDEAKPLTAFTCGPLGFYECEKMPFGASNAPATFQRLMENYLGDLNLRWCVVYLDDIIVYGKSPEEILERLGAVFEKLRKAGLKLKPSKCEFFKEQIKFLGHIVSKEGISTCPEKVHAVQEWPIPETINDLRTFLGFVGYYRKFIKGFSQIAKPLNSLLEGYVNNKRANKVQTIPWGSEQQESFNALQQACMSAPILGYPNPERPFILHTDASLDGLGAVLYQKDESGQVRVIAYASRFLSKSEKNYAAHRLEFLALKWAITEKFRDYLYGGTFEVFTDNNPLTYILTSAKLDATTQRWIASLASFNFSISYRSGKSNVDADSLSRIKWPDSANEECLVSQTQVKIPKESVLACFQGVNIPFGYIEIIARSAQALPTPDLDNSFESMKKWKKEQQKDPQLCETINLLHGLDRYEKRKNILKKYPLTEPYLKILNQLELKDDILYRRVYSMDQGVNACLWQLVLPQQLISRALFGCHDQCGHQGRDRTLSLLRERFYWPSLYRDTIEHLESCRKCLLRKRNVPKAELVPISVTRPMELVHLDYLCLEPCKGKIENVLVVTDHFTKYAQAFPTKSQTASTTAQVLWNNFICHYGFPEKFISDQGRNFESELIKDLCRLAKVKKVRTTPYHPMTNGQCERFNQTLCDMLGTLETEEKADWKAFIHTLTHAYNCTRHSVTGHSPFYLMFGRHPRLPVDVEFGIHKIGNDISFSKSKFIDRLHKHLGHAYRKARTFAGKESDRQKVLFDRKSKDLRLEPGDIMLVRKTAWQARHKIQNKWEDDDYVVISQQNPEIPVYRVRNVVSGQEKTLHRNLLLPLGFKFHATTYEEDEEFEIVLPLVRELEGEDHLDFDDGTAQPVKDSDPSILIPRQPQVKFQDQPQVIEDSIPSYGEDSGSGVSSEKKCTSSAGSGVSCNDSTKLSGSGLTSEDPTKPETSLDSSSLYSSVFEEQSSTSREDLQSAEADTSLEASKSSGPTTVLPQIEEHAAKKASTSSEEDDSQDSEPVQAIQPRRSLRSTRGAPPTRFGYAISHKLVCPYFQFLKNGKIQLSSKL